MAGSKNKQSRKAFRILLRTTLVLFLSSTLYAVLGRFIMPPVTMTQVGAFLGGYGLKRDYIGWDEMPRSIKLAAIASEDQLFASHGGFDWKSLDKSLNGQTKRRKRKRVRGGAASTISQQTAKNVFLWQGSGWTRYVRKVPEFYFTGVIELTWGKKRILEVYLNCIEMGPGIFGVEAASRAYFHKPAKSLSQSEAAMIIACLPNPKKFTVKPLSRRVQWRYPQIIVQMNHLTGNPDIEEILSE